MTSPKKEKRRRTAKRKREGKKENTGKKYGSAVRTSRIDIKI